MMMTMMMIGWMCYDRSARKVYQRRNGMLRIARPSRRNTRAVQGHCLSIEQLVLHCELCSGGD